MVSNKTYKLIIMIFMLLGALSIFYWGLFALNKVYIHLYIFSVISGFVLTAVTVPLLDYSIELTYPVNPSYSNTFLNFTATLLFIGIGEVYSVTITQPKGAESCIVMTFSMMALSFILSLFLAEPKVFDKEE